MERPAIPFSSISWKPIVMEPLIYANGEWEPGEAQVHASFVHFSWARLERENQKGANIQAGIIDTQAFGDAGIGGATATSIRHPGHDSRKGVVMMKMIFEFPIGS